jgi:hypothetical protein
MIGVFWKRESICIKLKPTSPLNLHTVFLSSHLWSTENLKTRRLLRDASHKSPRQSVSFTTTAYYTSCLLHPTTNPSTPASFAGRTRTYRNRRTAAWLVHRSRVYLISFAAYSYGKPIVYIVYTDKVTSSLHAQVALVYHKVTYFLFFAWLARVPYLSRVEPSIYSI